MHESDRPQRLLNAYVADYLKEEVAAEGLVRNLPVFSEFLNLAALSDRHCQLNADGAEISSPSGKVCELLRE